MFKKLIQMIARHPHSRQPSDKPTARFWSVYVVLFPVVALSVFLGRCFGGYARLAVGVTRLVCWTVVIAEWRTLGRPGLLFWIVVGGEVALFGGRWLYRRFVPQHIRDAYREAVGG